MLSTLIDGRVDLADVLLLIAVILFAVATVIAIARRTVEGALIPAGLACLALALLVL